MARRKRNLLEDDDSDSSVSDAAEYGGYNDPNYDPNDADAREERELFENPYQRKRRRKNAKEDAIYGVFASSDEEDERSGPSKGQQKRRDWAKAPAFVSGDKPVELDSTTNTVDQPDSSEDSDGGEDMEESKPPSPRVPEEEEEEEEERPHFGGIGSGKSNLGLSGGFSGFSKGGIGSFKLSSTLETPKDSPTPKEPSPDPPTPAAENLPSAFGASRAQRSFLRDGGGIGSGSSTPRPATPLSASERQHFSKLRGTFGARMLAKMGWTAGSGLGTTGEGIVTPVESKLRPKGMGLAFKGFQEKTEQSKAEARRRGEVVSDDEDEKKEKPKKARKPRGKPEPKPSDTWRRARKAKHSKIEHKTYEEIIAEAGQETPATGLGQIIDATGATPREVSSLADVGTWGPTADPMRLPELRHNLRLMTEACKNDLDGLAKEAREIEQRKRWIRDEDRRLRKQIEDEAGLISRLQQIHLVVDDINTQAKQAASTYEATLEPFSPNFDKLVGLYPNEFDRYRLDEIVIAAIAPVVRRMFASWQPLENPTDFTANFRLWRKALKMNIPDETGVTQVQVYGSSTIITTPAAIEKPMTPYESLIWNAWLPKVRSALNNDWSPEKPQPAVQLYEAWSTLLPPFVRDNFFDQLILPKVHKAVGDWNPRKQHTRLHMIVFPWLPHIGPRSEDVLGDARRKVKSMLRHWTVADGPPEDLKDWKNVFDSGDWDTMLLKYVVPKLGARLREDFRVNPNKQDMEPLQDILSWEHLLRPSILSQILETEFFPKWLNVLYIWLVEPNASLGEISVWYEAWKKSFSENVQAMPGVSQGFIRGLQLMNKALELGPNAPTHLPRPETGPPVGGSPRAAPAKEPAKIRPARTQEIPFRSIAEDYASSHNLLFIPTGRAHEKSRMPLFRVSQSVDGKGGLLVYISGDAVWAPDGDEYRAISLEDMVLRATKA